jgi:ketosteroid isomerase-like protein
MRSLMIGVLCALIALAGCSRKPDEQRIREAIAAMQKAAEGHELRAFMAHVSDDFTGNKGNYDRAALANLMRMEVLRNDQVGVTLGPISVDLDGERAIVRVTVTLTGGSGGLLPEHGAIYSITSGWKRQGSDWLCYNAQWEQEL